jgi:cell volume regulation protein A
MNVGFDADPAVLIGSLLLISGIVAARITARWRVPGLLVFLALGMIAGDEGLGLVRFDDAALAGDLAVVALVVILFEGGLTTPRSAWRDAAAPAGLLATFGVAMTAGIVGLAAWGLLGLDPTTAALLGAVISSTDAAAVFAALRSRPLPARTRSILQLESGLNDPMAILLTAGMVEVWRSSPSVSDWVVFLGGQLLGGASIGLAIGLIARNLVTSWSGEHRSSLGVLSLAVAGAAYGSAAVVGASGFMAVFVTGAVLSPLVRRIGGLRTFHEGLAATAQAALFLILGLLVFPSRLLDDLDEAVVATAVLVFLARPLAVHLLMPLVRVRWRDAVVVSWAGLRGAVPVVMATIPLTAGHPDGSLVFDVAFVVVVISVAVQGPSVAPLARRLGLDGEAPSPRTDVIPLDDLDADLIEIDVPSTSRVDGQRLASVPLPPGLRVAWLQRGATAVVPDGDTVLQAGDRLLVICPIDHDLDLLEHWVLDATPDTSKPPDEPHPGAGITTRDGDTG